MALAVVVPIAKSAVVEVKNTLFAPFNDPVPVKPDEFIPKSPKYVDEVVLLLPTIKSVDAAVPLFVFAKITCA